MERAPFNGEAAVSPQRNDYLSLRRPQAPRKQIVAIKLPSPPLGPSAIPSRVLALAITRGVVLATDELVHVALCERRTAAPVYLLTST
jgi:hypothetical protein